MSNRYRKRPIIIEAVQWLGWTEGPHDLGIQHLDLTPEKGRIATLEGDYSVTPGDWIITGIQGEKYPCKPDIFEQTYEAAEAEAVNDEV